MRDPVTTIDDVYSKLGWPIDDDVRGRIATYAKNKPKDSRGAHAYARADTGLDAEEEREQYRFYMKRYGIGTEAS